MKSLIKLFVIYSITINFIQCAQVCYDGYGCFSDEYPFGGSLDRPFSRLPSHPSTINTKLHLYNNCTDGSMISQLKESGDIQYNFYPSLPTKVIIHGFMESAYLPYVKEMKSALLEAERCNVIAVDWSDGAEANSVDSYIQATANARIVGAEIANTINWLIRDLNANAKDFHLIGHSLGAHIAGYAGERINNLGRITGLDPVSPYFEMSEPVVRLDSGDADYVDIIHSNTFKVVGNFFSFGIQIPIGHADYYPNGGVTQPGCRLTDGNIYDPACSHDASNKLFTDTIKNKCPYTAFKCASNDEFDNGQCLRCTPGTCNRMGYYSELNRAQGSMYLNTASVKNYNMCMQNYEVTLKSGEQGRKLAKGKFEIYLETTNEISKSELLDNGYIVFRSNSIERMKVSLNPPLQGKPIRKVSVVYTRGWDVITYEHSWMFESIEVLNADTQEMVRLCPIESLFGLTYTIEYTSEECDS